MSEVHRSLPPELEKMDRYRRLAGALHSCARSELAGRNPGAANVLLERALEAVDTATRALPADGTLEAAEHEEHLQSLVILRDNVISASAEIVTG
ncbi:hypothetical protein [Streptomyces sp. NPDC059928]|uniref:hypothetical protein n=1 Tax=unclassified Streptomyces TaxID=2593676 RepID=UPI00366589AB